MFRRLTMAGGACLALAACSDDRPTPTGVHGNDVSTYAASGQVIVTGFGRADTLAASSRGTLGKGLSLNRAGTADGKGPVLPLLIVRDGGANVSGGGGTFRDAQGRLHRLVVVSDGMGAPPREFQHYIDNKLVRTTTMQWERRAGAWVQSDLRLREFKGDSVFLDTHAKAASVRLSSRSLGERSLGERSLGERTLGERTLGERTLAQRSMGEHTLAKVAFGIAQAFAPREAHAQAGTCAREWQIYIMAAGYASAAAMALEHAMMTMNPAIISAAVMNYLLAATAMTIAEYNLYLCTGEHGTSGGGGKPIIAAPTRLTH